MTKEQHEAECPWVVTMAGWQKGASEVESNNSDESEAALRAMVGQLNRDALSKVQEETGVPIPAHAYSAWRPTKRVRGEIDGVGVGVIVATDGVLGIFVECPVAVGHVHRFRWTDGDSERVGAPSALFGVSKGGASRRSGQGRRKVKEKSVAQRFMEELLA